MQVELVMHERCVQMACIAHGLHFCYAYTDDLLIAKLVNYDLVQLSH